MLSDGETNFGLIFDGIIYGGRHPSLSWCPSDRRILLCTKVSHAYRFTWKNLERDKQGGYILISNQNRWIHKSLSQRTKRGQRVSNPSPSCTLWRQFSKNITVLSHHANWLGFDAPNLGKTSASLLILEPMARKKKYGLRLILYSQHEIHSTA